MSRLILGDGEVAFGAAGHRWVRVAAATLTDGATIVLPQAAPAVLVRVREHDGGPGARRARGRRARLAGRDAAHGRGRHAGARRPRAGPRERARGRARAQRRPRCGCEAGREREVRVVLEPGAGGHGARRGGRTRRRSRGRCSRPSTRAACLGSRPVARPTARFRLRAPVEAVLAVRVAWTGWPASASRPGRRWGGSRWTSARSRCRNARWRSRGACAAGRAAPAHASRSSRRRRRCCAKLVGPESVLTPAWSVPARARRLLRRPRACRTPSRCA